MFTDVLLGRRLRRLELIVCILFEQASTGSITLDHQEVLAKLVEQLITEMHQEDSVEIPRREPETEE